MCCIWIFNCKLFEKLFTIICTISVTLLQKDFIPRSQRFFPALSTTNLDLVFSDRRSFTRGRGNVATRLVRTKQRGDRRFSAGTARDFLRVGAINETSAIIFARVPRIVTARRRFWHDPLRHRYEGSSLGIALKPIKAPGIITITFRSLQTLL